MGMKRGIWRCEKDIDYMKLKIMLLYVAESMCEVPYIDVPVNISITKIK